MAKRSATFLDLKVSIYINVQAVVSAVQGREGASGKSNVKRLCMLTCTCGMLGSASSSLRRCGSESIPSFSRSAAVENRPSGDTRC